MNVRAASISSQCTITSASFTSANLAFRAPRPAALPSSRQAWPSHVCRAGKKQGAKKAAKVQVPTTPPAKENVAAPEEIPTEDPAVSAVEEEEQVVVEEEVVQAQVEVQQTMTTEEIAAQMSKLRAASKENAAKEGFVEVCTRLCIVMFSI